MGFTGLSLAPVQYIGIALPCCKGSWISRSPSLLVGGAVAMGETPESPQEPLVFPDLLARETSPGSAAVKTPHSTIPFSAPNSNVN